MKLRRALLVTVLVLCGALPAQAVPGPPDAGSPADEAASRYDLALRYFKESNFTAALAEFEAAHQLSGRWEVLFNIAVTQRRLFRYHQAIGSFRRYLDEGGAAIGRDRRADVERELEQIASASAEVTIDVSGGTATVTLDGVVVGEAPLDGPVHVGSGRHVLAARRGRARAEVALDVIAGRPQRVELAPRLPPPTMLLVTSRPPGALVSDDGKEVGRTPWTGEVTVGGHRVRARLRGHDDAETEVAVVAAQRRSVVLELRATRPAARPRWYARWYVIGGGVLLAGAIGAGVWWVTRPEEFSIEWDHPADPE